MEDGRACVLEGGRDSRERDDNSGGTDRGIVLVEGGVGGDEPGASVEGAPVVSVVVLERNL